MLRRIMFCSKCGSSTNEEDNFCRKCGRSLQQPSLDTQKKKIPKWCKVFLSLSVATIFLFAWFSFSSDDLTDSIEGQLSALRAHSITEAYYQYTTRDFQTNVPLPRFREIINGYAALAQNKEIRLDDRLIQNGLATLKGMLTSVDGGTVPVTYELVKEDNIWKIDSMLLAMPTARSTSSAAFADWLIPIDAMLRALREKNVGRGYNDSTSSEFKKATTLDDFKKYVERYTILTSHKNLVVQSQETQQNSADVTVVLNPDEEAVPVRFMLTRENGNWKIWNMYVVLPYSPAVTALLGDVQSLRPVVAAFLNQLQANEYEQAYDTVTSKEFQKTSTLSEFHAFLKKYPMLMQHDSIEYGKPTIIEGTGTLPVDLVFKNGTAHVDFVLGIQNDEWKIWGIKVVKYNEESSSTAPSVSPREEPEEASVKPPSPNDLKFERIEVGDKVDEVGNIINPQKFVQVSSGNIYVNLFIHNAVKGSKVDLTIEHIASHTVLPVVSTTLEKEGDSRLSFSFQAPSQGWPRGRYQMRAESTTGVSRDFVFDVR